MPAVIPVVASIGGAVANKVLNSGGAEPQMAPQQQLVSDAQLKQTYDNTQQGLAQQQNFVNALQGQGGIQNQSDVYNQYGQIASGQGPNPAQAMLAQATGANVANQAALAAGQRGAGANAGLIARQAGMQGGALQQQAAGQGATMQANQQLAALGAQGNIAGQQVGSLGAANNAYSQTALGQQGQLLNAGAASNQRAVEQQQGANKINQENRAADRATTGGLIGGIGSAIGATDWGKVMGGGGGGGGASGGGGGMGGGTLGATLSPGMAHGGAVKGPSSGFGQFRHGIAMKQGGYVPGEAKIEGDHKANDTVPAMLSPGEIVIPRSVVDAPDAVSKAAAFVQAILAKNKMLPSKG